MTNLLITRIIATVLFLILYIRIERETNALCAKSKRLKNSIKGLVLSSVFLNLFYAILDSMNILGYFNGLFITIRVAISLGFTIANLALTMVLFSEITNED
jgi:lipid-A-disaccharide synthase-like uncharacterized protein